MKKGVKIPSYTLGEELVNSISHGIGGALSIAALVLLLVKSNIAKEYLCSLAFGIAMIILYIMSTMYHALSSKVKGKKVFRILDHCSVYLLVLGTYTPIALLAVGETKGWILFGIVSIVTTIGIITTIVNIDKYQVLSVICHLINGWSIIIVIKTLFNNIGTPGVIFLIIGGLLYTIGALLYAVGTKKKYMHSVFHFFCIAGTIFHFFTIYLYIL